MFTHIPKGSAEDYEHAIQAAQQAYKTWAAVHLLPSHEHMHSPPATQLTSPYRGEIVRQIGEALRKHKANLGKLVSPSFLPSFLCTLVYDSMCVDAGVT